MESRINGKEELSVATQAEGIQKIIEKEKHLG